MTDRSSSSRRSFLKTVVVTASAASVPGVLVGCGTGGGREPAVAFPQSVASGDPRADSIVLWTRVAVPAGAMADAMVRLELATDVAFGTRVTLSSDMFIAEAANDSTLRVKVVGLVAGTRYYYRFHYGADVSRTGRFKTAAAPTADVPVRFALASCQDFVGRYYNSYLKLLEAEQDDLDFVLHVGDYVYETTGDPSFMSATPGRAVTLTDTAGAIALTENGQTFYAARSVDNYRQLYKTYRSDPTLQQVHEKFPFVVIWDDHEFSDDSWQANATYTGGRAEELDPERRVNAEQAFFEYQPLARTDEAASGALELARDRLYPNTVLYRDLRFGKNAHLVLSDSRSFRSDHAIPESAWPGTVAVTQARVRAVLEARIAAGRLTGTVDAAFTSGGYRSYVDLQLPAYARHKAAALGILTAAYTAGGAEASRAAALATTAVAGAADAAVLNQTIEAGRAGLPAELRDVPVIDAADPTLERGVSYASLGKSGLFGSVGSRYLVIAKYFDVLAEDRATRNEGGTVLGQTQQTFIETAIAANTDATWTLFGSSVSFTPLTLDVRAFAAQLPAGFPAEIFYLNVDQWDGFPVEKNRLLETVLRPRNAVMLSGDIHAAFVTDHRPNASGQRAVELTCPGVSSGSFKQLLGLAAQGVPALAGSAAVGVVLSLLDTLVMNGRPTEVMYANNDVNGLVLARVDGTALTAELHLLAPAAVTTSSYANPAGLSWTVVRARCAREGAVNGAVTLT